MTAGYQYLASPYSHPNTNVRHLRYLEAQKALAWLVTHQLWTYSPIVHCHEMTKAHAMPTDAKSWQNFNHMMILRSSGTLVLKIEGWDLSKGLSEEIEFSKLLGLPVALIERDFGNGYTITRDCF